MSILGGAFFLARKDLQYMLRARETIIWTFVMPIMFFWMIGTITSGFGGGSTKDRLAVDVPEDAGFLWDRLARRLEEQDYQIVDPTTEENEGITWARRLEIPAGFTDKVLAGEEMKLKFVRVGEGLGTDFDQVRLNRAVYTVLADLVVTAEGGETPSPEAFDRLDAIPRSLTLEVAPAGVRREIPTGFEQAIPGTMVMFTLLVLLTSGAVLLVIERRQGVLKRIASTPLSREQVVLGKWGGKMVLALVQIGFAMLTGTLLFGMDWGPNLPMIAVVLFAYASMAASFGILAGSLARTEGQAIGLGVLASNVLAALGGCWWPIEVVPAWMQTMSMGLPTGWAMDAMHKMVSFGASPASVLPHVMALLATAIVAGAVSARVFRFE